jgi:uncharacterized membrane protein YgaE (UPF0421/DUF939 family)
MLNFVVGVVSGTILVLVVLLISKSIDSKKKAVEDQVKRLWEGIHNAQETISMVNIRVIKLEDRLEEKDKKSRPI